jgi:hypothetical protein
MAASLIRQIQLLQQRGQRRTMLPQLGDQRVDHRLPLTAPNNPLSNASGGCHVINQVHFATRIEQHPFLINPKLVLSVHLTPDFGPILGSSDSSVGRLLM